MNTTNPLPKWGAHGQMRPDDFSRLVKVGDACRHRGTKEWARVTAVIPQPHHRSAELVLVDEVGETRYWATYHVDYYLPGEPPQ